MLTSSSYSFLRDSSRQASVKTVAGQVSSSLRWCNTLLLAARWCLVSDRPPSTRSDAAILWLSQSEAPHVYLQRNIRFSERENWESLSAWDAPSLLQTSQDAPVRVLSLILPYHFFYLLFAKLQTIFDISKHSDDFFEASKVSRGLRDVKWH